MNKEKILKDINDLSWLIGPWKEQSWKMAINGLMDYTRRKMVYGFLDSHIHLDRCFTYKPEFLPPGINLNKIADLGLQIKQDLVGYLHDGSAYSKESLHDRMTKQIERAIKIGTREMWGVVDTTPDIGLRAFNIAKEMQEKYKEEINLKVGCYPVFGLKNTLLENDRINIIEEAAKQAEFIVGLPEKDEKDGRIGFKGHTNLLLEIGYKFKKEVHLHADQSNSGMQKETLKIIECLEGLTPEKLDWFMNSDKPKLKIIHVISPSCYDSEKFSKLVESLLKYNIGVICCPRAGISMRQLRSEKTPTHNSIARIIEMLKAGINVSIGTDNVNDIFVPSGDGLILSEIDLLFDHIRNYTVHILVKIGMGIDLNKGDRAILAGALHETKKLCRAHAEKINKEHQKKFIVDF